MKRHLQKLVSIAVFCFLFANPIRAQNLVAIVNFEKLFNQYWKTGLMKVALKEKGKEFDQTVQQMTPGLQKARDKYQKMLGQSDSLALSSEQRAKYQHDAEGQLEHVQELEYNLAAFERQARTTLGERESRARKDLLADISTAIANMAKTKGYSLVVDAENQDADADLSVPPLPPIVVYADGANDLTGSVPSQLNADAPVDTSSTDGRTLVINKHK